MILFIEVIVKTENSVRDCPRHCCVGGTVNFVGEKLNYSLFSKRIQTQHTQHMQRPDSPSVKTNGSSNENFQLACACGVCWVVCALWSMNADHTSTDQLFPSIEIKNEEIL